MICSAHASEPRPIDPLVGHLKQAYIYFIAKVKPSLASE